MNGAAESTRGWGGTSERAKRVECSRGASAREAGIPPSSERPHDQVRGQHTFLVQGTAFPANDNFMELLFWIDALKRASAASVTAVIPYFSYAKGDKKDEPRVSIRARVCADAIEAAGVDRVVTMDLHAPQLQGFFHVPVDDLYAMPTLCDAIESKAFHALVVVAPDAGFAKRARAYAKRLGVP